jgi:hypothetical protein
MLWQRGAIGAGAVMLATCLIAVPLSGQSSRGGQQPASTVGWHADTGCSQAAKWAQTHAAVARLFGATSTVDGYEPKHSTWREYPSRRALEEAAEGGNLFYVAYLRSRLARRYTRCRLGRS